jgi:hypothetical protein
MKMSMADKAAELERRAESQKKEAFERWLDDPMVRMGMSMIPPGERAEGLRMLLQSAFNTGFGAGSGLMLATMMEVIVKKHGP